MVKRRNWKERLNWKKTDGFKFDTLLGVHQRFIYWTGEFHSFRNAGGLPSSIVRILNSMVDNSQVNVNVFIMWFVGHLERWEETFLIIKFSLAIIRLKCDWWNRQDREIQPGHSLIFSPLSSPKKSQTIDSILISNRIGIRMPLSRWFHFTVSHLQSPNRSQQGRLVPFAFVIFNERLSMLWPLKWIQVDSQGAFRHQDKGSFDTMMIWFHSIIITPEMERDSALSMLLRHRYFLFK